MGVSRRCVRRWITHSRAEGEDALWGRLSRLHTCPRRTDARTEKAVIGLCGSERLGRERISDRLGVPARTISCILARNGPPRLAALDPLTGGLIRASKIAVVRYQRGRPGELVHMDIKKLGQNAWSFV